MSRGGLVHALPPRRALRRALPFLLVTLAALSGPRRAEATDTQWWILDSPADYAHSEAHGVVVRPDGSLELGPATRSSPVDSLTVVWAVLPLRDGSVALAGDHGRILRWSESGGLRPWARLPVGQVLCLAADGDGVVAGSGPEGLVYRVSARGDTTLLARTGERYVWSLAPAARGAWWAASGTRGRLLRIEDGRCRIVFDSDESNLVPLLADGHGGVFTGGDSKGRVYRVAASGEARTLFDASEDEIRALAFGPDGALYAAALSAPSVDDDKETEGPQPVKTAPSGARSSLYRIVPDSSVTLWWTSPQPTIYALGSLKGETPGVLAACGNRAALYLVERAAGATQWLQAPQGQITALAVDAKGQVFAATSNPAHLWRLGPGRAGEGELASMPLDARRMARFGALTWQGEARGGRVTLESRSGNTEEPDTTWSPWVGGRGEAGGGRSGAPAARYLQWRVRLAGGAPRIESVESAWREQNQAPRVEDVLVAPQGQGFREGELTPRMEPITQTLPGGQKVEYNAPPTATPKQLHDLPVWARGLRTVQWRASDPNGDALHYRIEVRREEDGDWIKVDGSVEVTSYTWDTGALPDGRYRVRVTASDEDANAVGEGLTASGVSQPFTVDNTPPAVDALEARAEGGGVVVVGHAQDALSPLQRIEVAVDDGAWRAVTPEGGLTDERAQPFRVRLADVAAGEHAVSVRAVDLAGNLATRAVHVTVPRR